MPPTLLTPHLLCDQPWTAETSRRIFGARDAGQPAGQSAGQPAGESGLRAAIQRFVLIEGNSRPCGAPIMIPETDAEPISKPPDMTEVLREIQQTGHCDDIQFMMIQVGSETVDLIFLPQCVAMQAVSPGRELRALEHIIDDPGRSRLAGGVLATLMMAPPASAHETLSRTRQANDTVATLRDIRADAFADARAAGYDLRALTTTDIRHGAVAGQKKIAATF